MPVSNQQPQDLTPQRDLRIIHAEDHSPGTGEAADRIGEGERETKKRV